MDEREGKKPNSLSPPIEPPAGAKKAEPSPWDGTNERSLYRPLAAIVAQHEAARGASDPYALPVVEPPAFPRAAHWPDLRSAPAYLEATIEERDDVGSATTIDHFADRSLRAIPSSLLWQPPLANPREPRMAAKLLSVDGVQSFDAALGGQFGLLRISPMHACHEGFQLDVFAAAFSRFQDERDLTAIDYRFGAPLTYAACSWQFKLAYELTFNEGQGAARIQAVGFRREEIVLGVGRRFDELLRAYAQLAYTISGTEAQQNDPYRTSAGVEWADLRCTTLNGAPFAAVDVESRGDQDDAVNVTVQLGWNWRGSVPGRGLRVGVEYFNGRSPFGQFFRLREEWYGGAAAFDW